MSKRKLKIVVLKDFGSKKVWFVFIFAGYRSRIMEKAILSF